jgi:hypothetical protein
MYVCIYICMYIYIYAGLADAVTEGLLRFGFQVRGGRVFYGSYMLRAYACVAPSPQSHSLSRPSSLSPFVPPSLLPPCLSACVCGSHGGSSRVLWVNTWWGVDKKKCVCGLGIGGHPQSPHRAGKRLLFLCLGRSARLDGEGGRRGGEICRIRRPLGAMQVAHEKCRLTRR